MEYLFKLFSVASSDGIDSRSSFAVGFKQSEVASSLWNIFLALMWRVRMIFKASEVAQLMKIKFRTPIFSTMSFWSMTFEIFK